MAREVVYVEDMHSYWFILTQMSIQLWGGIYVAAPLIWVPSERILEIKLYMV